MVENKYKFPLSDFCILQKDFFHRYVDTYSVRKTFTKRIMKGIYLSKKIVHDFYSINKFFGNIIIDGFTNKKTCQTKNNYEHNFVGTYNNDFIHITNGINPLVIYMLLLVFSLIFFKLFRILGGIQSSTSDSIYNGQWHFM